MSLGRRGFLQLVSGTGAMALGAGTARAREAKKPSQYDVGLLVDARRCIGCKACMVACADANDLPRESSAGKNAGLHQDPADLSGKTKNIIKLCTEGERNTFVKTQCMHCVDPACASVCMIGALHKAEGGVVAYDPDRCIGCRYCQVACPFNVPRFEWDKAAPLIVKCELCRHLLAKGGQPGCTEVCPTGAVVFGQRAKLIEEAQARLAAAPSDYEAEIYGDTEAGGTNVLYLAPKGVSFAAMGLPDLGNNPVPGLSETVQHSIYQGFIAPAVLYGFLGVAAFRSRKAESTGDSSGKGGES